MQTYFVITPGVDQGSYVEYSDGTRGNYVKFGDSNDDHETTEGIRAAYRTHNPDIGIAALINSNLSSPRLGTRLKNYIVGDLNIPPVPGTAEWFSLDTDAAWKLFAAMQGWDEATVDASNLGDLKQDIASALT